MKDFGPVVPIVTPYTPQGGIDLEGFSSICAEMLDAGCAGVFIAGSTGRGPWFDTNELHKLCRAASDQVKGRAALIAGCTASGLPRMLDNARSMADAGAEIIVATVPGYFHYNQSEIEKIYLKFADDSPLPVIVYDIPEFTSVKLDNSMLMKLANHENIIGFKDSSADFERFQALAESLQQIENFHLFQGKENLLADSLRIGASGFIVSLIHLEPAPFVNLYKAVRAENYEVGNRIQTEINKVIQLVKETIQRRPESSTLFHMLNYAVKQRNRCNGILLEHEGESPAWVIENTQRAIQICKDALNSFRVEL
jgi:dihydrodipicolinate synthase/N-acetylneuraminate lyase